MEQAINPELSKMIQLFLKDGYRVIEQTAVSAQMVRPKKFSCLLASLSFLLFGVGILFYLFYYWSQKDSTVYLQWDGSRVDVRKG